MKEQEVGVDMAGTVPIHKTYPFFSSLTSNHFLGSQEKENERGAGNIYIFFWKAKLDVMGKEEEIA